MQSVDVAFTPVAPRRTFEGAVEQIAERIRLGELAAGDRLPSERELAAAMQISRPTLREAVRVLADSGVLTVRPGSAGGTFVTSDYVPIELLRSKSDLRLDEVAGVLEARRLIEPRVAQLAAVNAREEDFAHLTRLIERQQELLDDGDVLAHEDRFLQLDTQFHVRIARATGNSTIVSLMRTLLRRLEIARDLALHEQPVAPWVIDVHERTLAAIRSADHERIERVMDEHLAAMERAWERATDRMLVRPIPDFMRPVAERGRDRAPE
ncbi:FCD domain-containing protein [Conexibacter arvalis]|uniref:DNA-binding FadR family transcriptional regulator n=1 Tax=Conexibacter arvalis TaxID=912552 RepID=A0A840I6T6_9ACTN|nr:DNA-binding FadR family transcriptional regulator [Conexibacter arvalis]